MKIRQNPLSRDSCSTNKADRKSTSTLNRARKKNSTFTSDTSQTFTSRLCNDNNFLWLALQGDPQTWIIGMLWSNVYFPRLWRKIDMRQRHVKNICTVPWILRDFGLWLGAYFHVWTSQCLNYQQTARPILSRDKVIVSIIGSFFIGQISLSIHCIRAYLRLIDGATGEKIPLADFAMHLAVNGNSGKAPCHTPGCQDSSM